MDWQHYHQQFETTIGRDCDQSEYKYAFQLREDELIADERRARRRLTATTRKEIRTTTATQITGWYRHAREHSLYQALLKAYELPNRHPPTIGNYLREVTLRLRYNASSTSPAALWVIALRLYHDVTPK